MRNLSKLIFQRVVAVSFGIAKALNTGSFDVISIVVDPLIEIVCSLALGALGGWVLTQLEKLFNSNTNRLNMTIAFVFLTSALAMAEFKIGPVTIGFSSLLTCMMLGTLFCNLCPLSGEIMEKADRWTSPLFAAFFVISGAGLDLGVFKDGMIVLIGVVYILTRSLGKYLGAHYSAKLMKCEPQICKYLGITLLPQAGVALGMCVTARQLGAEGDHLRAGRSAADQNGPAGRRRDPPDGRRRQEPPPDQSGKGERRKEIRQSSSQSPAPVRVLHTGEAATKSTEKSGRTLYRLGSSGFSAGFTTIVRVYEKTYCPTDWKNSQIPSCQILFVRYPNNE